MSKQLKNWLLNATKVEFYWFSDKSSSSSMYDKCNKTRNHSLLYNLQFTVFGILYCIVGFLLLPSLQYSYQVGFPISYPYQALPSPLYQQLLYISTPYQLSSKPIICLHQVIAPCTCIKSLITIWYQLFTSLTATFSPNKILVSGIPISYSSVTTQFLYSRSLH